MTSTASELKSEIKKTMDQLRTLKDEARVKVHLAGMDAKSAWDKLEPKILEAEKMAEDASEKSLEMISSTTKRLQKLMESL